MNECPHCLDKQSKLFNFAGNTKYRIKPTWDLNNSLRHRVSCYMFHGLIIVKQMNGQQCTLLIVAIVDI